jgi:hypothetical protein
MKTRNAVRLIALAACLSGGLVAAACGGSSPSSPSGPSGGGSGGSTVTFSTLQTQIFSVSCTACHTDQGRTPAAGLNLMPGVSYAALVNVASSEKPGAIRVIPTNADGSYLVQKLRGDPDIVGLRMPRNGPPYLTDDQINLVKAWITSGAKND